MLNGVSGANLIRRHRLAFIAGHSWWGHTFVGRQLRINLAQVSVSE
jgi:hypothetical protein